MSLLAKQKETHRLRTWTHGCWGDGVVGDFGKVLYTQQCLRWITSKELLYSTWNSAQCYVPAWMGGSLGENGYMYIYGWIPCLFTWNCHNIGYAAAAKLLQSCPTLSDPMDCSPPGSSIHGIFQARVLEWGATAFSEQGLHISFVSNWFIYRCNMVFSEVIKTYFAKSCLTTINFIQDQCSRSFHLWNV